MHAKSLQLCPTLCNPMNYSPPGSSVHGILQERILWWVAMPSSRGIFPIQRSNPCLLCLLHWQADSLPVVPPGNSRNCIYPSIYINKCSLVNIYLLCCTVGMGFPGGSAGKESACNEGDLGSIPGWGRSPREGEGYPLQYSGLENFMDCIVHGASNSRT